MTHCVTVLIGGLENDSQFHLYKLFTPLWITLRISEETPDEEHKGGQHQHDGGHAESPDHPCHAVTRPRHEDGDNVT